MPVAHALQIAGPPITVRGADHGVPGEQVATLGARDEVAGAARGVAGGGDDLDPVGVDVTAAEWDVDAVELGDVVELGQRRVKS